MKRLLLAGLCVAGVLLFTALGIWQLERRVWKLDLIHQVNTRIHAPAVTAPGPQAWPMLTAGNSAYEHVTATGRFLPGKTAYVLAVTDLGRGYWVMTPLATPTFTVWVNRGFVPPERRGTEALPADTVTITGLLRPTEPHGGFLRKNNPQAGRWFSRDVAALGAAQNLSATAPYFIDADATPNPAGWPKGGLTVISFPNNHLQYALTWFALALLCAYGLWRLRRVS